MATERIIHTHQSYKEAGEHDSHPSMASHIKAIDTARQKEWEWEQEDRIFYEKRTGSVVGDQWTPYKVEETEIYNCE